MQPQCADQQQQVNEYFESCASYWERIYHDASLLPTIYQDRMNTALDWISNLNLSRKARILEVGCGAGQLTIALARDGHVVDALDPTRAMLQLTCKEALRQRVQDRIRPYLADVYELPFATDAFDLVIAIGVVPWLRSEVVALREMRRILRRGGHILISADNEARLNRILDPLSSPVLTPLRVVTRRLLQRIGARSRESGFHAKRHHPREVNQLLENCHFKTVKSCTIGFGPFTAFGKEIFSDRLGVALHRRLQSLAWRRPWSPLSWNGSHYLVLAVNSGALENPTNRVCRDKRDFFCATSQESP